MSADTERNQPEERSASAPIWATATIAVALLASATATLFFILGGAGAEAESTTTTPLVVAVSRASAADGYDVERAYTGRIEPRRRSEVGFELDGKIVDVRFDDGDTVDAGVVLARLDTARLEARRAELAASRQEAEARLELAEATYRRAQRSHERNAASDQELDDAEEARDTARAALDLVSRRIDSIDVDIEKSTLRAPFDAVVARRFVDEGQVVAAGAPILELYERVAPEARVGVPARAAKSLAAGDQTTVRVRDRSIPARIERVLPVTETGSRTVEILLRLDAELDGLRRGDLVTLTIPRRIDQRGFWLPHDALTESARGLWACFVAEPIDTDGAATHRIERRQLEALHTESGRAFLTGTLAEGELVVQDGLQRIVVDQLVRIEMRSDDPS